MGCGPDLLQGERDFGCGGVTGVGVPYEESCVVCEARRWTVEVVAFGEAFTPDGSVIVCCESCVPEVLALAERLGAKRVLIVESDLL